MALDKRTLAWPRIGSMRRPREHAHWSAATFRLAVAFGQQLKRTRRARGWKQDSFAERLGVSRTTASNIERGMQRIFLDQLYSAAVILGVRLEELLPPIDAFAYHPAVRSASDDPVSPAIVRRLGILVRDLSTASTATKRRRPRRS